MSQNTTRPLPEPSKWSAPFWEAAKSGKLVIQTCYDCDKPIMYPRRYCPYCLGESLGFTPAKGTGQIYTLTTQMVGAPSGFEDMTPYVLAVVKLDEGVQMMSNVVGENALDAKIGDKVSVGFRPVEGTDTFLPVFSLNESGKS